MGASSMQLFENGFCFGFYRMPLNIARVKELRELAGE